MITLAIDTTAAFGSIALCDGAGVKEEILLHEPQGFSAALFSQIEALLARQRVRLAEIDLFAGASGPGSFTGVRIGLAAIKGLAEVLSKPAIAISNLEALSSFGTAALRAPVIDARRGEVYGGLYDSAGRPVVPEIVAPFPKLVSLLEGRDFEWISMDPELFPSVTMTRAPRALAAAIARIAMQRLANGGVSEPAAIEANYVRRSDAELLWKS
ncbi:MAG TPA: tRNA (adenosine(37)-N6)-threonylcarbamoyltransferase complex dimerization subunit type 1 TsaB [Bryobacteraceae bacterium]|nr:tRNA (adenosine(37)-N6)-threonylcarbamoyltransferase complex dimerization subunit type 1 TsaB [Bryobacteraceae bacterium]